MLKTIKIILRVSIKCLHKILKTRVLLHMKICYQVAEYMDLGHFLEKSHLAFV